MLPKKVDKKSKTLFYGKLEGVVHGTNMIMGPHFPHVLAHGQSVEQLIKLVAEASAQIERFDRQDESFDKKKKSNPANLRKHLTAKSSLKNRVTSFASRMAEIDFTAVVFVLSYLLYQIGAP